MGLLPGGGVAGKLPSPVDSYWLHLLTSPIMSSHRGWAEDRPGFVGTLRFRPGLWAPPAEGRRMRNGGGGGAGHRFLGPRDARSLAATSGTP